MKMFNEPLALATLGNTDVSNAGRATHSRQASSCDDESPWMCFINHAVRVNKTSMEALEGSQPAAEMTSEVKSYTSLSGWLILSERLELRYSFFLLSNLWYGENCFLLLLLHGCLAIPMMSRDLVTSSCQAAKAWATWRAPSDCCRKVNYTAQQVMSVSCRFQCYCGDEETTWSDRGCVAAVPFLAPHPGLRFSDADIWGVTWVQNQGVSLETWRESSRGRGGKKSVLSILNHSYYSQNKSLRSQSAMCSRSRDTLM